MLRAFLIALGLLAAQAVAQPADLKAADPKLAVEELLAADRAFSAGASKVDNPIVGIAAMFDEEVTMPSPKGHAIGRDAVLALFLENPSYKQGKVSWAPIRGGISADGMQGFTYGFLSLTGGDPARRERKYLAYWLKRPDGWRVVTYRQQVRDAGEVSKAMYPPSLPGFTAKAKLDTALIARNQRNVAAAEKSFSDRAQIVGLKIAFGEFGRPDAMNMYAGAGFDYGIDAVTARFKEEGPSKIHWSTERSFAASSGDLGVSIGTLLPNEAAANGKPGFPFFTIWRRDGPDQPWRYIAE